ncbi:MAG: hypothetical protein RMJ98_21815 [Myxococcales bacterium]|nr:hypothetical protein [Myxococcales bacterium]
MSRNLDPQLRGLPPLPPPLPRREAIRCHAAAAFEEAHQRPARTLLVACYALGAILTGAAAIYLFWAMKIARTFG